MTKFSYAAVFGTFLSLQVAVASELVPPGCVVEDWCLKTATKCFLGYMSNPQGLYQAHAQYSVVRKMELLCQSYYGPAERRSYTGPVEPIEFASSPESSASYAQAQVMGLCERYRNDFVSAAPACE